MRILHLVTRSQRRGAEIAALELAHELDALGHDNRVVALTSAFDGGVDPAIPALTDIHRTGVRLLAQGARRLRADLDEHPVDVVLAHGGTAAQVGTFARRPDGPPVVWQRILGFPPPFRGPVRWWWGYIARHVDGAFALSTSLGDELRDLGFTGPVWSLCNCRRPDRFLAIDRAHESARLREQLGLGPDVALLGLVGHLVRQKRPERSLEVMRKLLECGVDAHLVIAGDGPLRADVAQRIVDTGLTSHVTILGHRDDVECVLGAIDMLLLTSEAEGIPGVAIEAQMTGCPVVTYPLGAVSEVVIDGVTGVVLERPDSALMAKVVAEMIRSPGLLERFGAEARQWSDVFSIGPIAQRYAEHLQELIASPVPARQA